MSRHPLERLLAPSEPVPLDDPPGHATARGGGPAVTCAPGAAPAQWLDRGSWRLLAAVGQVSSRGRELASFHSESGETVSVRCQPGEWVELPFSLAEAYESYVMERWIAADNPRRLPPSALNAFYLVKRMIPRRTQLAARRILIRWQGSPEFPRWPFDPSVALLVRLYARCLLEAAGIERLPFRWFWPAGKRAALILTHDVEGIEGLRNAITVADLEEERGLRSSFNIVGDWYPLDWGILKELAGRGFELGVHGVYHDRSLFSDRAEFERQLPLLRAFADQLDAVGFRSPATHRVNPWLSELPARYDCTIPFSDPYEPQPGGCCSPWPYFIGDLVELPYTLPQDHTLFTLKREQGIDTWTQQVEALETHNGLVQCVTHPDPGYLGAAPNLRRYVEFLNLVCTRPTLWRTLPRDVAAWWRERDSARAEPGQSATGYASACDGPELAMLEPPTASPIPGA